MHIAWTAAASCLVATLTLTGCDKPAGGKAAATPTPRSSKSSSTKARTEDTCSTPPYGDRIAARKLPVYDGTRSYGSSEVIAHLRAGDTFTVMGRCGKRYEVSNVPDTEDGWGYIPSLAGTCQLDTEMGWSNQGWGQVHQVNLRQIRLHRRLDLADAGRPLPNGAVFFIDGSTHCLGRDVLAVGYLRRFPLEPLAGFIARDRSAFRKVTQRDLDNWNDRIRDTIR